MKVASRQIGDAVVVDLSGRITLGEGTAEVRDTVEQLAGKGHKQLVLNLARVTQIDSSGFDELVSVAADLRQQGGELKLLNLSNKVRDTLQITKLYTTFDVSDNEATAVAAFSKAA
jgi:anti-sigma B factor antagonist